jgi:hypothetical protein
MGKRKGAAGKEEGKALKGKEKAPRPHPLLYVVLWVSASARRPFALGMAFLENPTLAKITLASNAGGFSGRVGATPVVVPGGPFHLLGRSAPGAERGYHRVSLSTH